MKKAIIASSALLALMSVTACNNMKSTKLYSSEHFSIYADRVEQGPYKATAMADNILVSDYQSPANEFFNPHISFKFSINGRDNEAAAGMDHQTLLFKPDTGMQVVRCVFGVKDTLPVKPAEDKAALPANTPVKFEVDMRRVLEQLNKQGYYTDFNGNKLYKQDFKGVWIAGGTTPMSWDFENLPGRSDLQLTDTDGDGIYTCTLVFNVYDPVKHTTSKRVMESDLSEYPSFKSSFPLANALYRMSLEDLLLDKRPDSTFRAGKQWDGVWTRDISYSIILSLAAIDPQIARNSLMRKVNNGLIIQDTGSGGSWPVSTDRVVWALAAWEVYKTTGDKEWLKEVYAIISKTIENDIKVAYNPETGLFYGESSFLDWRKQTYPLWMEPIDIYRSHNLGTNALFYKTLTILDEMGKALGTDNDYGKRAEDLKNSINLHLWQDDKGYYGQYLYGHYNYSLSPRSESLGEALCILFNIASDEQKEKMFASVPVMEYGITCIYPQIPGIPPYHNNASWPFVQAYWSWAAARNGNSAATEHGIASIYRQAAFFLTNKENMVAGNGDFNGTEINSDNQLWSVAANLAVVYRIYFGLDYQIDKLVFNPFIPESLNGYYELTGLKYRNAKLDIYISGYGNGISSFELDGKTQNKNEIPAQLTGHHSVRIVMNGKYNKEPAKIAGSLFSPSTPDAEISGTVLKWKPAEGAVKYSIFCCGTLLGTTTDTHRDLKDMKGEYQVIAIANDGTESFLSKPLRNDMERDAVITEAEHFAKSSARKLSGYSGDGFVEINKESPVFTFRVNVPADGDYIIEFRYSNGNGHVNTNNMCAQRSLFCNGVYSGSAIFPQRGGDEWSNWGMSNLMEVELKAGENRLELRFEPYNNNMNVNVNSFMLDCVRCVYAGKLSK
jgi:glycogen debranching enzyme